MITQDFQGRHKHLDRQLILKGQPVQETANQLLGQVVDK
jgi:hypothetical protein